MVFTVILNGHERTFDDLPDAPTLSSLVEALGLKRDRVALEHNGEIVSRSLWDGVSLAKNDRIELVHFVGGGV